MNEKENKNIDKDKELKEEKESSELSDKSNKEKKVTKKEYLKEKSSDIEEQVEKAKTSENIEKQVSTDSFRQEDTSKKLEVKKKNPSLLKLFFTVVLAIVVGSVIVISILKWTPLLSKLDTEVSSSSNDKITTNTKKNTVYEKSSLAAAIENVYDSVVMVQSYKNGEVQSTGTGFIYKKDSNYGYVMTNQHVVSNADKVVLVLSNDEEIEAKILGGDEYLDLAVMSISKNKVPQVVTIGSSEDMKVGDTIFTVGTPMGYEYRGTVTSGILSGKDRLVSVSVSNSSSSDWVMKVLQIDAAINPGNSGGPLVNASGKVIGINSMKLVQDEIEGMGFAIPIEIAMAHIDELEKGKKIEWPLLGISMANVTDSTLLRKNGITIDKSIKEGTVVVEISEGSGASKSDLKPGDVITKLNGEKVKDTAYLRYELYKNKPGDTIEITYIRNGKENTTKVVLTKSDK